jgi:hypothetical protein
MRKSLRLAGLIVPLMLVVCGGSIAAGAKATTMYYSLPANALKSANWDADNRMWTSSQTVFNFDTSVTYPLEANAPIYLPQGAVIKSVTFYFTDNDPSSNGKIDFGVNRQKLATGALGAIATATTGALPASAARKSVNVAKIVNGKVDNLGFSYTLNVKFGLGTDLLKFHGAVIAYQ